MKYSELAELLTSAGTFLVGIAAVITAVKPTKKESDKKNHPRRFK